MSVNFHCGCGFTYKGDDLSGLNHQPPKDSCCNCGGVRCMDCVLRCYHDRCEDSCPDCCGEGAS